MFLRNADFSSITALEIGFHNLNNGITYNELKKRLIERGFTKDLQSNNFEVIFNHWFLMNFIDKDSKDRMVDNPAQRSRSASSFITHDKERHNKMKKYLSYEAQMAFVDYAELLRQARQSSRQAQRDAKKSIKIATWALIITSILAFASIIINLTQLLASIIFNFIQ